MSHNLLKQLIVKHDTQLAFIAFSNLKIMITIVSSDISFNHSKDKIKMCLNLIIQGNVVILIKFTKSAKESAEDE